MMTFDPTMLAAFDNGIEKIHCKHSPGKVQTDNRPPGLHQHREILFVLQGECDFPLNRRLIPVRAGQVVLIDSWLAHCARYSPSDRNLLCLWFYLFLSRLVTVIHRVDAFGKISGATEMVEFPFDLSMTVNRRWDELNHLPPDDVAANVNHFMNAPLQMLLDEYRLRFWKKAQNNGRHEDSLDFVSAVQGIIEANNGRGCSLEELEKFTGFSRFYISHAFKKTLGLTIGEYIDRCRMIFLESALKQGLSHKQVAFELGFSSSSSLSTWFRRCRQRKNKSPRQSEYISQ
ncbi:MAG: helix-turn-helix transcriptional regulator [Victivallales bacterium]|nr:helix-turn-helix transcriptional regulator [Victivallales bacterium]